jgi:hypothetical protein
MTLYKWKCPWQVLLPENMNSNSFSLTYLNLLHLNILFSYTSQEEQMAVFECQQQMYRREMNNNVDFLSIFKQLMMNSTSMDEHFNVHPLLQPSFPFSLSFLSPTSLLFPSLRPPRVRHFLLSPSQKAIMELRPPL